MEKHKVVDGKKYEIPDYIDLGMPVSLRQPFKKIEDVRMINDFVSIPIKMPIRKSFLEALGDIKPRF
jgi:hypothetical protein